MRIATRPLLVVAAMAGLAACGAVAIYHPVRTTQVRPPAAAGPDHRLAYADEPWIAAEPPSVSAIGTARSFGSAEPTRLRPGRSLWQPERAAGGPVGIVVDLGRQMAYVYRAGTLIGVSTVSSGRRHYETPVGAYPILEKAVWHRSTIYSGAPMPYMQRLTWGGVALHAGGVPGYRQSHGCIHLPPAFARSLFKVTTIGSEVRVVRSFDPAPVYPAAVDPAWADTAPAGPTTIAARAPFPSTAQSAAVITAAAL